eukprot:4869522-Pyramimonas_sp.AAC.2
MPIAGWAHHPSERQQTAAKRWRVAGSPLQGRCLQMRANHLASKVHGQGVLQNGGHDDRILGVRRVGADRELIRAMLWLQDIGLGSGGHDRLARNDGDT